MGKAKLIHFAMIFFGVLLIAASVGVGVGALHYTFQFDSKIESPDDWKTPVYEYQRLSEDEQRVVDRARNGEKLVFDSNEPIPGREKTSLGNQKMLVLYPNDDEYHVFIHKIIFVPTDPAGYTAIVMVLVGLGLVADAIRRHHFPHRNLLWQEK